jgi:hypothetical protein
MTDVSAYIKKRPRRGDGASSGFLLGGNHDGEGRPIRCLFITPPAALAIINNRQFSGLFDAALTALATD